MVRRVLLGAIGALVTIVTVASAERSAVASSTERSADGRSATERLFRLDGRLAWVTGASRGLGLEMAAGLAECGAHVVLSGRDEHTLAQSRDEICSRHPEAKCTLFALDVLDEDQVNTALPRLVEAVGRAPDILVNNAGIAPVGETGEDDTEQFKKVMRVNLLAPYILSRECAKAMKERGWGRVVNTCSIMAEKGAADQPAYCASKHALAGLTRSLADELASDGITVNGICPGFFLTKMTKPRQQDAQIKAGITARIPAGEWGRPDQLAGPVVFLASDASEYVNGALLVVDGGMTASFHMGGAGN